MNRILIAFLLLLFSCAQLQAATAWCIGPTYGDFWVFRDTPPPGENTLPGPNCYLQGLGSEGGSIAFVWGISNANTFTASYASDFNSWSTSGGAGFWSNVTGTGPHETNTETMPAFAQQLIPLAQGWRTWLNSNPGVNIENFKLYLGYTPPEEPEGDCSPSPVILNHEDMEAVRRIMGPDMAFTRGEDITDEEDLNGIVAFSEDDETGEIEVTVRNNTHASGGLYRYDEHTVNVTFDAEGNPSVTVTSQAKYVNAETGCIHDDDREPGEIFPDVLVDYWVSRRDGAQVAGMDRRTYIDEPYNEQRENDIQVGMEQNDPGGGNGLPPRADDDPPDEASELAALNSINNTLGRMSQQLGEENVNSNILINGQNLTNSLLAENNEHLEDIKDALTESPGPGDFDNPLGDGGVGAGEGLGDGLNLRMDTSWLPTSSGQEELLGTIELPTLIGEPITYQIKANPDTSTPIGEAFSWLRTMVKGLLSIFFFYVFFHATVNVFRR